MRVNWNEVGSRSYETGVDRGVFYPRNSPGVPWNGLISVKEAPTDSESRAFYQDGIKHQNGQSGGSFAAQIDAFTYPTMLDDYRGSFGLSYRTLTNNDISQGYKIHLVYNAQSVPSMVDYSTIDTGSSPTLFSWNLSTVPVKISGVGYSAHLIIDSTKVYPGVMENFENILYGTSDTIPSLPSIQTVLDFFEEYAIIKITDHGDGTWSAEGPDELIQMIDPITFEIDSLGAVYIDLNTYKIRSW